VSLAQQGRQDAFTELMRRTYPAAFQQALSILRDRPDAEDEVQNAYWSAYRHIGQFQQEAKFSTWMTRIVMNRCLMRLRQERRAQFLYLDHAYLDHAVAGHRQTPESELRRKEAAELLASEIRRIPPLLRNTLVLRDVNELPMPVVAERLGISVAAAKSRLLRARQELRARLLRQTSGGAAAPRPC